MKYSASFKVLASNEAVKALSPEANSAKEDRSFIRIHKKKGAVEFIIGADDLTAFKSSFVSVIRSLEILEKMRNIA